jgi:hypothetical protein
MNQNINETPDQENTEEMLEEIAEVLGLPQSALEADLQQEPEGAPSKDGDTDEGEDPCEGGGGCL